MLKNTRTKYTDIINEGQLKLNQTYLKHIKKS